ncbi:MAG TPA: hypothetical protein EYN66_04905 [Myxococcales bacterium]|nr:hypothetical protein [Myxococcales bacterium]
MTLVGGVGVGGTGTQIGGLTAAQLANIQASQDRQDANKAAAAAAAAERAAAAAAGGGVNGNGANGGTPWAPSVGIPDNFFGFVMLTLGLR